MSLSDIMEKTKLFLMSYITTNSLKKIALVAVIVLAAIFGTQKAHAETTALSGWAWSSNIGWISFNSADSGAGGGPYAVTVATSSGSSIGTLGGYAWSSNIGWIKFGGLSAFPSGGQVTDNATVDFTTGNISGWVRACAGTTDGRCGSMTSRTDGWDGWISLSGSNYSSPNTSGYQGTSTQGVTLGVDKTKPLAYGKLSGFAWGGDVVGWLNFGAIASIPGTGVTVCGTECDEENTTPAFNVSGASATIPRQVGASARPGILVSGGTSGDQSIVVTIKSGFAAPSGTTVTLLDGSNVSAASVTCAISGSSPSCSLAKVRVAVTDITTAPEEINIPIVGTRSDNTVIEAVVHVVIPQVSSSDLSLWAVPSLPSGSYDTVTRLSSVTIREGSTANLAWETAGVDAGSCRGLSTGVNDSANLSGWKAAQPESQDSNTPFQISGLVKGQYRLILQCTVSGSDISTSAVDIKVIKSTETPF